MPGDKPEAQSRSPEKAYCCDRQHLTAREIEILCAVADGDTNKQTAAKLFISEHTVHRYMTIMLRRTGARSRTALVSQAYRSGILIMEDDGLRWSGRRCLHAEGLRNA
jgi:DNA-binding CsgD family transcriptional regulator